MDPIGLALDNFDVTAQWRVRENGMPLDTRGDFFDGTPVTSPSELCDVLLKRPMPLVRTFTENLLAYALGRRAEYFDQPPIRAIAKNAEKDDYRMSSFILGVVKSDAFRMKRAEPGHRDGGGGRSALTHGRGDRDDVVHHWKAPGPPHVPAWRGRDRGPAVPGCDGARRAYLRQGAGGRAHAAGLHRRGARPRRLQQPGARASTCSRPRRWGRDFKLVADNPLSTLEAYREYMTIVSNTDVRMAEAFTAPEIGGDHFRSSAVFLTQSHPKQTQGSDIWAGTSMDQLYAQRFGQDTPLPSMQFCIENLDQAGGCTYNYSCAYTDSISWASPNEPLPMIRDPRVAFDLLFGAGGSAKDRAARRENRRSILDWIQGEVANGPPGPRRERPRPARPLPRQRARDRAPHPGRRSAEQQRRRARDSRTRRRACPTRSRSTCT